MYQATRLLVLLAVVTLLVVGSSPAALVQEADPPPTPSYDIVELDTPGGEASRAYGINDQGWVVGHMYDAADRQRAMLWQDGNPIDIGTLGGDHATALSVNDRGQVVGAATTASGAALFDPGTHAFLWEAGRMQDLGSFGGNLSTAQDINVRGQIVGASTTAPGQSLESFTDGPHAFLWEDGRMIDLGTLGGDRSWALAVNDAGQVVGTAQTTNGEDHAFFWEDGVMTDLGALAGGQAIALAINRHGQVVGGSTTGVGQEFAAAGTLPFHWDAGDMTALGEASGSEGIAYGINDRGGIVGNDPDVGAVLWRGKEATALADLLPEGGGWELVGLARAINEQGQIVGWGQRDGATRAFVASPTAPGAKSGTPGTRATPAALMEDLDAPEVVARSQDAIRYAGTYRFQMFLPNVGDGDPIRGGEVEIGRGERTSLADGSRLEYFDGQTLYTQKPDGEWLVRIPQMDQYEWLVSFLEPSAAKWEMSGLKSVDGQTFYVIQKTEEESSGFTTTHTLWIDAVTFLPRKVTSHFTIGDSGHDGNTTLYSDFGARVHVIPPPAALAPTPTPAPLPETNGGRITIALRDVYFEPNAVSIPAKKDVLIVVPNEGVTTHNFTIDEVGISSGNVEWGTTAHIIVNLPPGVYEFHCDIPGHTEAGQVGTLTVRE